VIDFSRAKEFRRRRDSVLVDGVEYKIRVEFYHWVAFEDMLEAPGELTLEAFDHLYVWGVPENREAGFRELLEFYRNEQPIPRPSPGRSSVRGIDWKLDSEYIRAAFLESYGIDLVEADPHWHDFLALFNALSGTKLNEIVSARYDDSKKGPLADMRRAWELTGTGKKKEPLMRMV
jgi:hypothetical protein